MRATSRCVIGGRGKARVRRIVAHSIEMSREQDRLASRVVARAQFADDISARHSAGPNGNPSPDELSVEGREEIAPDREHGQSDARTAHEPFGQKAVLAGVLGGQDPDRPMAGKVRSQRVKVRTLGHGLEDDPGPVVGARVEPPRHARSELRRISRSWVFRHL